VTLTVIPPPAIPRDVTPQNVTEGVRVTWSGAGPGYRVFRRVEGNSGFVVLGDTQGREFVDRTTEYGKTYYYGVQAIAKTGTGDVESELSIAAAITPKDTFPPAVPGGLTTVPTANTIELAWERDTEADLAGYRIYRAGPGGDFQRIGESGETPSYSDRQIEAGKLYRYSISAFDKSGNESKLSEPIEVTAQ
jgi:fibronectin type 3 domain-containing protein